MGRRGILGPDNSSFLLLVLVTRQTNNGIDPSGWVVFFGGREGWVGVSEASECPTRKTAVRGSLMSQQIGLQVVNRRLSAVFSGEDFVRLCNVNQGCTKTEASTDVLVKYSTPTH